VKTTSSTRKSELSAKQSYDKPERLLKLIHRYLRHHNDLEEINKKITAGGVTTKKQEEEAEAVKSRLKVEMDNIYAEKGRILNKYIFPAMANLTVLLEQMREHLYIREIFEDDVKELFLQTSSNKPGWPIFHRFVEVCVCKRERGKHPDSKDLEGLAPDFRAMLGEYMQRAVYEMMKEMIPRKSEDAYFLQEIMGSDMARPIVWSKYFAAEARRKLPSHLKPDENGMPQGEHTRPALF